MERFKVNSLFHRDHLFLSRLRAALPCLLLMGLSLRAADVPSAFTIDLPFGATQATPAWLGHPESPAGTFASLSLPIAPPDDNASLLVTVFFTEKSGGFLRIGWQGAGGAQVLSDNFYEGIDMSNQRSLLVTADTMKQSGALNFQSGDSTLGIQRIELAWLENQSGLISPAITDTLVTPALGATTPEFELNGQPQPADSPAWHDRIVNVPVTDAPLRIEQGVEFNVEMDAVPSTARLVLKEAGLPWGWHLVVWIDNKRAGTIFPAVPPLDDGGFAADGKTPYVGWREGTFFVPVSSFATGLNTLQFSAESDSPTPADAATVAPLAVKDVSFQLDYPASAPTPAPATVPAAPATSAPSITPPAAAPVAPTTNAPGATAPAPSPADIPAPPSTGPDAPSAWPKTPIGDTP